jgi:hypothetical protein|tara:strand:+ start:669 stop:962 length:294 start_codon:yes stop_codon:yes gene_type:complete
MPANIKVPIPVSGTVSKMKITDFSVDIERRELHITFDQQDSSDNKITDHTITLDEPYFTQALVKASEVVGGNVYAAIKTGMYYGIAQKDPEFDNTEI